MKGRYSKLVAVSCSVLAFAMVANPAVATQLDLTKVGAEGAICGAIFRQIDTQPTGTGVFDPFVRIQAKKTEQGYNTDGTLEFDTKGGPWTHSLLLGDLASVTENGVVYLAFTLDINEDKTKTGRYLSLDQMKIYLLPSPSMTGYPGNFGMPVYDLDSDTNNAVKLDYELNPGSGAGDMLALIPKSLFTGNNNYVYLFSRFGDTFSSDAGFEEWSALQGAPEPTTIGLLAIGGLTLLLRRR